MSTSTSGSMPLAFGAILTGGYLLDRGIKDVKIGLSSSTSTSAPAGPSGPLPSGGQKHGLVSTAALSSVGQKYGWSASEIADWMKVIVAESNGTLTDTNPSSGAYGIAQFIQGPSEYYTYGGNPNTLLGQLTAMAAYIHQRYGTPSAAWAHEQSSHWY